MWLLPGIVLVRLGGGQNALHAGQFVSNLTPVCTAADAGSGVCATECHLQSCTSAGINVQGVGAARSGRSNAKITTPLVTAAFSSSNRPAQWYAVEQNTSAVYSPNDIRYWEDGPLGNLRAATAVRHDHGAAASCLKPVRITQHQSARA